MSQKVFFSFKLISEGRTSLLGIRFVLMQVPNHTSYAGRVARKPIIETLKPSKALFCFGQYYTVIKRIHMFKYIVFHCLPYSVAYFNILPALC